jgi:hypothetical protein
MVKPRPEHVRSDERLALVGLQALRLSERAAWRGELAGQAVHRAVLQEHRPAPGALAQPDRGDLQVGLPRPLHARDGARQGTAAREQGVEADLAGVPLGDGVGGDQAELPVRAQQARGPQEEVGAQIRAAPAAIGEVTDEVIAIVGAERPGEALPSLERRVADDRVEAPAREDLREHERPVQRCALRMARSPALLEEGLGLIAELRPQPRALLLALLLLCTWQPGLVVPRQEAQRLHRQVLEGVVEGLVLPVRGEGGAGDQIAEQLEIGGRLTRLLLEEQLVPHVEDRGRREALDLLAGLSRARELALDVLLRREQAVDRAAARGVEVEGEQLLLAGEAEQRVPRDERMVQEGEGAVLLQGDQPEGELRHFDRPGVLVDPEQAAIGDEATGDRQALVLSRLERGRRPARAAAHALRHRLLGRLAAGLGLGRWVGEQRALDDEHARQQARATRRRQQRRDHHLGQRPARQLPVRRDQHLVSAARLGLAPCLDETLRQVAARLHEEGARAHRQVAHPQGQDLFRGPEAPLGGRLALGGPSYTSGSRVCSTTGSVSVRGV